MKVAAFLAGVRVVLAVSLVPASVAGGVGSLLWAMNTDIDLVAN